MSDDPRPLTSDYDPAMALVSVRLPASDLEALRLAAHATGGSVAHLIRSGVQLKLAELRRTPRFIGELKSKRDELSRLLADLEDGTSAPEAGLEDLVPNTGGNATSKITVSRDNES